MTDRQEQDVAALRGFNRIYTTQLGLLDAHLDQSVTLSEARILRTGQRADPTQRKSLRAAPGRGADSRTIKRFANRGLIAMRDDASHGRHELLSLTERGRKAFAALEGNTRQAVGALLDGVPFAAHDCSPPPGQ